MNLREVITQFVPSGFRDEDGVWHEGPLRVNAELELAALTNGLERAAYLVEHLVQQVPEFTGVIGPAGEREDDSIRDALIEEAHSWREQAEATQERPVEYGDTQPVPKDTEPPEPHLA